MNTIKKDDEHKKSFFMHQYLPLLWHLPVWNQLWSAAIRLETGNLITWNEERTNNHHQFSLWSNLLLHKKGQFSINWSSQPSFCKKNWVGFSMKLGPCFYVLLQKSYALHYPKMRGQNQDHSETDSQFSKRKKANSLMLITHHTISSYPDLNSATFSE